MRKMESKKETTYTYKVEDSASRMDDILDANDNDYEDNSYIREKEDIDSEIDIPPFLRNRDDF